MVADIFVALLFIFKKLTIKFHIFRIDPKLPSIIAIGDSWLNLTLFDWRKYRKNIDTIDFLRLSHKYNIIDCAIPGYKIADEVRQKLFRTAITSVPGDFVILLSFGGNDLTLNFERYIRGTGEKAKLNKKLLRKAIRMLYLKYFKLYLDLMYLEINSMNAQLSKSKIKKQLRCLIHGYDSFKPLVLTDGKFHERFDKFMKLDIPNDHAVKLVKEFVDVTNMELKKFCDKTVNLTYIDLRGLLYDVQWSDALHPAPLGFSRIAERFINEISKLS